MAPKPSRDMLIHCDICGEDYSATYRRCPFCGGRNAPKRAPAREAAPPPAPPRARVRDEEEPEDGYVFDGQDAFDDEPEEEYYAPRPKGGKRLAPKQGGHFDPPPINWPRLITFLCSLVIIVAALIIVFTFIYPQLHGNKDPKTDASQEVSEPPSQDSGFIDNTASMESFSPVDPVDPSQPLEPIQPAGPTSIKLDKTDFTLWVGESYQITASFTPSDWSGQVTWTSSIPECASVSDTGMVTNVNTSGVFHNVYITATANGVSATCVVRVQAGRKGADTTQATPAPAVTQAPATQAPSGGSATVGTLGTIVGADSGLRVRSGPGTSYDVVASLLNGNTVNVLAAAENGWYQVSFTGSGGTVITGYIMGDYISTN